MSATQIAADLIIERGFGTVDDILPSMPGYTRDQVFRALQAAAARGLIECDGRRLPEGGPKKKSHRATGRPRGSKPATYRAKRTARRPVRSVFELAACEA